MVPCLLHQIMSIYLSVPTIPFHKPCGWSHFFHPCPLAALALQCMCIKNNTKIEMVLIPKHVTEHNCTPHNLSNNLDNLKWTKTSMKVLSLHIAPTQKTLRHKVNLSVEKGKHKFQVLSGSKYSISLNILQKITVPTNRTKTSVFLLIIYY